jgi:hypothetical protein
VHLPASATLLADRHTGNDIGDIIEELAGVAEIDPGRLKARGIGIVGGGPRMPPILAAAPYSAALFRRQQVSRRVSSEVPAAGSCPSIIIMPASLNSSAALMRAAGGTEGMSRLIRRRASPGTRASCRQPRPEGRDGCRAFHADGSVIHARQIVEDTRRRVRKLDAAGRWQDAMQRIVAKDLPCGNGNKSAPAMAAAKHGIAGGAGDLGVRSLGKKLYEEIFHPRGARPPWWHRSPRRLFSPTELGLSCASPRPKAG